MCSTNSVWSRTPAHMAAWNLTQLVMIFAVFAAAASAEADTAASAGIGLGSGLRTIGGVGYVAPQGWSVKEGGGVVVMIGPVAPQYQPCLLVIDPTVRPAGDMAMQLEAIVDSGFGRQFGPYHGETGTDLKADQYQGCRAAPEDPSRTRS